MYQYQGSKYKFISKIKYCQDYSKDLKCIECPDNSICRFGVIIGCKTGYTFVNKDICLKSKQMQSLVFKMYLRSLEIVAETNAFNLCQNQSK